MSRASTGPLDHHRPQDARRLSPLLEELGTLEVYSHHISTGRLLHQHLTNEGPPRIVTQLRREVPTRLKPLISANKL